MPIRQVEPRARGSALVSPLPISLGAALVIAVVGIAVWRRRRMSLRT